VIYSSIYVMENSLNTKERSHEARISKRSE
jgi:hypothetical protein